MAAGVFDVVGSGVRSRALVAMMLGAMLALAACGGGDDEAAATQNPPGNPPGNPPPSGQVSISGTPATQAMQGQQYSFTPTASGPSGATLTFSITNMPSQSHGWQFNTSTGRLSGTPAAAQVGTTYSNVRISVSDGTNTASLPAFNIAVVGTATGSALLSWTPPTTNTDGSALTLTGYRVYWGTQQGSYPNSANVGPNVANHMVQQLTPATWYFVVTALSATGESAYSNVASKVVQ
jgi:hypothetical protein